MLAKTGAGRPKIARDHDSVYLACDELNFTWRGNEVIQFEEMWGKGEDIQVIANEMKRDPDELIILAIDRARLGRIIQRPGGLLGVSGI